MGMVETPSYEVTKQINGVEIRLYSSLLLATVSKEDTEEPFSILFEYISGNNLSKSKISMTAPVITSEQIKMTIPVISKTESMSFVMPSKYTMESLPVPNDNRVRVHKIPERKIAVIRFGGWARDKSVEQQKAKLISVLEQNDLEFVGDPFLMRYNSPWTPGFLRRNEIAIELI
jgi:hypothetical protein